MARSTPPRDRANRKRGFTLVELLVVIGIIGLLVGLLMPALNRARQQARSTQCLSNLAELGKALVMYNNDYQGFNIPSYTMTGVAGGATVPLEGWAPILDRDNYIKAQEQDNVGSVFVCPEMLDIEGMKDGQTGNDPNKARGWMDWPNLRLGTLNQPTTIPDRGFNKIIRVGYWINADNPIGSATVVRPDVFYTSSVGYGPGSNGLFLKHTKITRVRRPADLIVLADGVYAGRQRDNRLGTTNCRIGYRHPGAVPRANVAYADGHAASLDGVGFPRGYGGSNVAAEVRTENLSGSTVYADPVTASP